MGNGLQRARLLVPDWSYEAAPPEATLERPWSCCSASTAWSTSHSSQGMILGLGPGIEISLAYHRFTYKLHKKLIKSDWPQGQDSIYYHWFGSFGISVMLCYRHLTLEFCCLPSPRINISSPIRLTAEEVNIYSNLSHGTPWCEWPSSEHPAHTGWQPTHQGLPQSLAHRSPGPPGPSTSGPCHEDKWEKESSWCLTSLHLVALGTSMK